MNSIAEKRMIEILPEMLEDEVDEEGNVEAFVIGWDYDAVLVLLHSHFLIFSFTRSNSSAIYAYGIKMVHKLVKESQINFALINHFYTE